MSDPSSSYQDDPTILDEAELWRRIPPLHIVPDNNRGGLRISSAAFEDHPNGSAMSVLLGDEVLASGRDAQSVISQYPGFLLASVTAGLARSLDQGIIRKPLPDEEPAHAEVFGRKTGSVRKKLSRGATWIIGPEE
jgi:hypothetical protein